MDIALASNPATRPRMLMCYLCGREFGTKSLPIHTPQCQKKWQDEESKKPKKLRRPLPQPPIEGLPAEGSTKEIDNFNEIVYQHWEKEVLEQCAFCFRTFRPEALRIHNRSCTAERPAKPIGATGLTGSAPSLSPEATPPRGSPSSSTHISPPPSKQQSQSGIVVPTPGSPSPKRSEVSTPKRSDISTHKRPDVSTANHGPAPLPPSPGVPEPRIPSTQMTTGTLGEANSEPSSPLQALPLSMIPRPSFKQPLTTPTSIAFPNQAQPSPGPATPAAAYDSTPSALSGRTSPSALQGRPSAIPRDLPLTTSSGPDMPKDLPPRDSHVMPSSPLERNVPQSRPPVPKPKVTHSSEPTTQPQPSLPARSDVNSPPRLEPKLSSRVEPDSPPRCDPNSGPKPAPSLPLRFDPPVSPSKLRDATTLPGSQDTHASNATATDPNAEPSSPAADSSPHHPHRRSLTNARPTSPAPVRRASQGSKAGGMRSSASDVDNLKKAIGDGGKGSGPASSKPVKIGKAKVVPSPGSITAALLAGVPSSSLGKPVTAAPAKFCDSCGAAYQRDTSRFCAECGTKRLGAS